MTDVDVERKESAFRRLAANYRERAQRPHDLSDKWNRKDLIEGARIAEQLADELAARARLAHEPTTTT